jgi:hypothetical protein
MPSVLHNTFTTKLVKEIERELQTHATEEPSTEDYIDKIESVSGVQEYPVDDDGKQRKIRHEPDIAFMHKGAAWPGVVVEVSHSQKKKSLVDLADDYILGTDGGTGVMVGIDLDYKRSKEATISIWRLNLYTNDEGEEEGEVVQVVDSQVSLLTVHLNANLT